MDKYEQEKTDKEILERFRTGFNPQETVKRLEKERVYQEGKKQVMATLDELSRRRSLDNMSDAELVEQLKERYKIRQGKEEEGAKPGSLWRVADLKPRWLWERDRILDLLEAVRVRVETGKEVPQEWLDELVGNFKN